MTREDELFRINDTAFYTFDIRILKERIGYIKAALPEDVSVCYAVKANPFIVREIERDVDGFEVCSPGEAEICERLEIPSKKMVISGVYKTPSFIEKLIANPGRITAAVQPVMRPVATVWKKDKYPASSDK